MRSLERLIEITTKIIERDNPIPLDLMVALEEKGVIIDELVNRVLTESTYKDI